MASIKRKSLCFVVLGLLTASLSLFAKNTPCSGKKGGVSHCQGPIFICQNGSKSQSKQKCTVEGIERINQQRTDKHALLSGAQPTIRTWTDEKGTVHYSD